MNAKQWKKTIESQIKFDRDYVPSFQTTIVVLSEILEERDRVYQMYLDEGAQPVVKFTTDRGSVNPKPNPLLKQWHDLSVTALQYLRDLGLTAAGLRKLQGQIPKEKVNTSGLADFRSKYGLDSLIESRDIQNAVKPRKTSSVKNQVSEDKPKRPRGRPRKNPISGNT